MFQMTQMISKPKRITKSYLTLLNLVFTNKPDRITKTYNLITGLSDHNLTLAARKLILRDHNQHTKKYNPNISFIPKKDLALIRKEIKETRRTDISDNKSCEQASNDLMMSFKAIVLRYTKTRSKKLNTKHNLPWFDIHLWDIMKK